MKFNNVQIFGVAGGLEEVLSVQCRITGSGFATVEQAEKVIRLAPEMVRVLRAVNESAWFSQHLGTPEGRMVAAILSRISA